LVEYDADHYLIKEEVTHFGAKKVILKNKTTGKISEKVVVRKSFAYYSFMTKSKLIFLIASALLSATSHAQKITLLTSSTKTSIRGLSVVSDKIIWASGSNGTVGKSVDGGKTWQWIIVKNFEKNDFRDIEAFDAKTAIVIAIAEPLIFENY